MRIRFDIFEIIEWFIVPSLWLNVMLILNALNIISLHYVSINISFMIVGILLTEVYRSYKKRKRKKIREQELRLIKAKSDNIHLFKRDDE